MEAASAIAFRHHLILCSTVYQYTGQMNYGDCAANVRSTAGNNFHFVLLIALHMPLLMLRTDSVNPPFLLLWLSR